ncbi:MAG: hydroxypyruvate isomerase [Hahellaceae bacterium]|nr:hydroxypyruvate isomerase [Hahellaceae bacterium]MCP5210222.1 hydroxypyruvate isomerase [Hahellaceae bacterium]
MPKFAANLSMLFTELPFLERFSAARQAGFDGVEYLFPYDWPISDLQDRLQRSQLQQVLFNLPPGDWEGGERGIACHPDRQDEFRSGVELAIKYAKALGCSQLNCLSGIAPVDADKALIESTLVQNINYAAQRLARENIRLMVEAINSRVDIPGFWLDTSAKVVDLIKRLGTDNAYLQFDIYHAQIMHGDILRHISKYLGTIGHIQFADNPGRHEPGTGELNFRSIFKALDEMGYRGWVSAEYRPKLTTLESLRWFDPSITAS